MDALRDAHVKRLGSAFQQAPAGKAFPAKCAELAKNVVEALLDAHPAEGTRMGDAFKLQFKALLANAKSVYDHLEAGSTPHEVAVMAPKQMASAAVQRKNREILEEEIEAETLNEVWSARCQECGLRKASMSNTNILTDLEDSESWRKLEQDDDFCNCEEDEGELEADNAEGRTDGTSLPEAADLATSARKRASSAEPDDAPVVKLQKIG